MPKYVVKVGPEAAKVKSTEGFARYSGPTPPPGAYPVRVRSIRATESKSGDDMLAVMMVVSAPKQDSRSKYNGFPIFHRLMLPLETTEEYFELKVGQINRLLDALSNNSPAAKQAFWSNKAVTDATKKPKFLKIGPIDLQGKEGLPAVVDIKLRKYEVKDPNTPGKVREGVSADVNDILPPTAKLAAVKDEPEEEAEEYDDTAEDDGFVDEMEEGPDSAEDEEEGYDDEEDEEPDSAEDAEEDEADPEDGEEEDEPDEAAEYEEEPEPEPEPERRPRKAAPKSAAARKAAANRRDEERRLSAAAAEEDEVEEEPEETPPARSARKAPAKRTPVDDSVPSTPPRRSRRTAL